MGKSKSTKKLPLLFKIAKSVIKSNYFQALQNLIWPKNCPLCGEIILENQELNFCQNCQKGLLYLPDDNNCLKCGRPYYGIKNNIKCPDCLKNEPFFDWAYSIFDYEESIKKAISLFKYKNQIRLNKELSALMAEKLKPPFYPPLFDYIIPIPLHAKKLKQRNFNQSWELIKELYKPWKHKLKSQGLFKTSYTKSPQASLNRKKRQLALKGTFAINPKIDWQDKNILIVDDVFTTGSTANEAAKTLKEVQVKKVVILTLARVIPKSWKENI